MALGDWFFQSWLSCIRIRCSSFMKRGSCVGIRYTSSGEHRSICGYPADRFTRFTSIRVRCLTMCSKFQLTRRGTLWTVAVAICNASGRYRFGMMRVWVYRSANSLASAVLGSISRAYRSASLKSWDRFCAFGVRSNSAATRSEMYGVWSPSLMRWNNRFVLAVIRGSSWATRALSTEVSR